jgi:hypothetical protein
MSVRRSIVLGFVVAVLLAGCQGDPEPKVEPTPSESSSETSPSKDPQPQTAEEFIDEWFDLAVEFQNTGESEALAAVSQDCRPCQSLIDRVERIYKAGGQVRIERMAVTSVRPIAQHEYAATVKASQTRVRESANGSTQTIPGNTNEYRVFLTRAGDGWNMSNYHDTPS